MGVIENRALDRAQYLEQLQKEYIATKIRLATYTKDSDLRYYQKVLNSKRQDINSLAYREGITNTVVNSEAKFNKFLSEFLKNGFPNFTYYGNGLKTQVAQKFDFLKYYDRGKIVLIDGEIEGKILDADFKTKRVLVYVKEAEDVWEKCDYSRVCRKDFSVCF